VKLFAVVNNKDKTMRETKYSKTLYKAIRKLNLDKEELKQLLLCLYINGCSSEDCAKLFGTTEDKIIKFLRSEELYGYKVCSKCGQLKDLEKDFRQYKNQKNLICKDCKIESNKKIGKEYRKNNKEKRKEYMKTYNEENKEKIKESRQEYNKNNRDKIKGYYQKNASIEQVQKLKGIEEVSGNQIRCKYCGKWMTPTINQVHNRLRSIRTIDGNYIYCSKECKQECPTYQQKKYPKGFKVASSREVNPVLRQMVLKRDNYTCQMCSKFENVKLHCHHAIPAINSPMEEDDPKNCITLCKECHKKVHKIPGCGYAELKCT